MSASSFSAAQQRASTLHLPAGPWATVLDCLCAHFPAIDRATWLDRMARGRVLDSDGQPIGPQHLYREGLRIHYFREVAQETPIPFEESVLHVDEHLVVADKPHFLPVTPSGQYVEQTLLARLAKRLDNPLLVPLHRIDRLTAGLVLFSANPDSRAAYQALFRERRIDKMYEAIAPALPQLEFPHLRRSRLVDGDPFILMREAEGVPNSETRIEVLERRGEWWRYALYPVTGKRHQLRVHMSALGAPLRGDPLYPVLLPREQREPEDYARPLKLLARELDFIDPLSGQPRQFQSRLQLDW
ncbi:RluA family pseudouridine synthase [Pseudomonas sp. ZM23]|uniref:RluA family pseudouridine synthase n=1 Tax=Pseudomonas triclosanedens TaxID=2961893 RepID=A0ABY7A173_9PSED|nr:RluA family pseudouridine synthase [Pseudomonas triclosanedens]MCP8464687.1 RluA family pseudouridine synthase [Pseudomonas triclosanedens]MCP8473618.1 RluA family pseudouridine synthase [Pseudomonas triclosanedens]MCP8478455.1 RluA family pseudouridine synthase [Pseudomonas triclosanedens]WAI50833.1 RluA family pseudouridine synthase [Pseudomonas triclosanedens]